MAFRWWRRKGKKKESVEEQDITLDWEQELPELGEESEEEMLPPEQKGASAVNSEAEQESVVPVGRAEQIRYVRDCCEAIQESDRQIDAVKKEYEQVTEYLTDIQKIDRIAGEDRENMLELCKRIHNLLQERNLFKNREMTISDRQVRRFDRYQERLIDEIKKMYENEIYQKAIESDMGYLEKEKAYQRQVQRENMQKQTALKAMAKVLAVLIISLFVLFVVIYYNMDVDMTYPYLGTLLLAAVSATVIFTEANKNRREVALSEQKMNKAIGLLNRTKIKYINNVSVLDYNREKYGVKSAAEFEAMWGEYCKAKEYERKFRENTERLSKSNDALLQLLESYRVTDTEVWLVQTYAILDNREMVEIRHDLNQRRGKLRKQIEYNTKNREGYLRQIKNLIVQNPEREEEIRRVLREYRR